MSVEESVKRELAVWKRGYKELREAASELEYAAHALGTSFAIEGAGVKMQTADARLSASLETLEVAEPAWLAEHRYREEG